MEDRIYASKKPETKRENSVSKNLKTEFSQSPNSPIDYVLQLHKTIGNQAVQRLHKNSELRSNNPGKIENLVNFGIYIDMKL